jgi:putative DNA primase/helicase
MNNFQNIHADLKASCRWVLWRLEDQEQRKGLKVPYQAKSPKHGASHSNPDHWASFQEALDTFNAGGFDGIGLVIGNPFIGLDLDKVRDPVTGAVEPWAEQWITEADTYTEVSQSGKGFHLWFKGEIPATYKGDEKGGVRKGKAEIYGSKRYFVMTGEEGNGKPIRQLDKGKSKYWFDRVATGSNKEAPATKTSPALSSKKLQRLLNTEVSKTQSVSEMVQSALTQLATETLCDKAEMERLFTESTFFKTCHWSTDGKWNRLRESELNKACANAREYKKTQPKKSEAIDPDPDSWRELFTTYAEDDDPSFDWLVKDFIEVGGAHGIAGPSGNGKTLFAMSLAKALVLGTPFLNHFEVPKAYPVLYLIPESGSRSFRKRLRSFRLTLGDDRFLYRTLSHGVTISLHDKRMPAAVKGRVIFLDTAIRFIQGDENSASENHKYLAQDVFNLLSAGALAVILIHHATKAGAEGDVMTLENVLRGSGDIGAMLNDVYGLRQINKPSNLIHVEQVKARDIEYLPPFQVEGRPWIDDEGDFRLKKKPGECGSLKEEKRDGKNDKQRQVLELKRAGKSYTQIEEMTGIPTSTAQRWWKESNKQGQLNIEEDSHGM